METHTVGAVEIGTTVDVPYLRRAQALLATRSELFPAAPARSVWPAGTPGPPQDRTGSSARRGGRQLSLPLPRERGRRRARMVR